MAKTISDVTVYFILGILLFFLRTNFDPNLAGVFFTGLVVTWLYYNYDKHHSIVIESNRNLGKSFVYAIMGYVAVIAISTLIKGANVFGITDTRSILQIMAETQATFAFGESLFLTFIAFAILVPIIETSFIGTVFEFIKDRLNIDFNRMNAKLLLVFFVISTGFMYLHISAKGITNTAALMTVFVFAMITCYLIFVEKQTLAAILLHIISNAVALAISYGWFEALSTSIMFGAGIIFVIIYLLKYVRITPRRFLGG